MVGLGFAALAIGIALAFFVAIMVLLELGRRIGVSRFAQLGEDSRSGVGTTDAAIFGLFALLLGFSFSHATSRFDYRRDLVAKEVNAVSNAWERIDVLPAELQPSVRAGLRQYVDALLVAYDDPGSMENWLREPPATQRAHKDVWTSAVAATTTPGGDQARMLLLPALSEMFGIAGQERLARRIHPPKIIFVMLAVAALAVALFAGYGLGTKGPRNYVYMISAAASIAFAMYVIVELEYPRLGLIRVNDMDRALVELRTTLQ